MDDLSGQAIKGYELQERLGAGGFGAVYKAHQTTVGREVAIKVILPGFANQPDFIRRFEAEAQLVARLEHLHITPLYDYWRDVDGAYLVMRYLRGGSLRDTLVESAFSVDTTGLMLDQIGSGLALAHRQSVIHRDLKPGNILLDEEGNFYLADFGIAKDTAQPSDELTAADAVVGSLDYLSPEQARSEPVTPRTDIYSLGVVLYEALAGEHPFKDASSVERLYKHINDPLPCIENTLDPAILDAVNEVIQKATAKNPDHRYPDAIALAAAFRDAAGLNRAGVTESVVEQLTQREQEILRLIVDGRSNREIANQLYVSVNTVKWHIRQIYTKLGVRSRVQAIVRAREFNLIANGQTSDILLPDTPTVISLPEPENPYKGLHAFHAADAPDFFGRESLTQKLIAHMKEDHHFGRFLTVVGPSGSGKSSVVKAGLIPALWRGELPDSERWFVVDMIPGAHPLDELETALIRVAANQASNLDEQLKRDERGLLRVANIILPQDDTELVIVVDQFEEVFTHLEGESARQHFLNLLLTAVTDSRSRVRIIVTLRADYYDRPLHYPDFGEMVRQRMETVLPLAAKDLERAIRGPADRAGVTFEAGLVEQIVSEMTYQSGALPLLQYALTELFDRREGRLLTHAAYQTIGGAVGALANRADEIFLSLTDEAQALTHQMFLRLVTLGEGAEDTRRRTDQSELLSLTDDTDLMEEIIDTFAAYRLLSLDSDPTTRQPTVEVAHEAILREWEQLRIWLNNSREDIRQERLLAHAAEQWKAHQQERSYLLRGARLEQMEKWGEITDLTLTPPEKDYIAQSIQNRTHEEQAEAKRAAKEQALERRSRNALRGLVAVMSTAAVIAISLALFAFSQRNQAENARDEAQIERNNAQQSAAEFRSVALTFGAQDALNNGQSDWALALAQEAINMDNPPFEAEQMFFHASSSTWVQQRFLVSIPRVLDAVYHPDGKRIITSSWDGRVAIWDIETGEELQSFQRDRRHLKIAVHPNGNLVAVGSLGQIMQIWNLDTGEVIELSRSGSDHTAPVFNQNGTLLVTSSSDGIIYIWETQNFTLLRSFKAHDNTVPSITFSPDESMLITGSWDGSVKIWDFETEELLQSLELTSQVYGAIMLADNSRVLIDTIEGEVFLWDWRSDEIVWSVAYPTGVMDIAISPDEKTFVLGIADPIHEAELRDVDTGELINAYQGHTQRIQNVDYSPDGETVVTASTDGTAIVWPVHWDGTIQTANVPSATATVWHPNRPLVATVGEASLEADIDNTIRLVDTRTGEIIREMENQQERVFVLAFSPDGRFLLSTGNVGTFVWDIETGMQVYSLIEAQEDSFRSNAVSSGNRIAAGDESGGIALWDLETGDNVGLLEGHHDWVISLVFSPDGRYLYSGSRDGSLLQWDMETGEIVREFAGHDTHVFALDLNSDGTQLLSASGDQTAVVWDTASGEALMTLKAHTDWVTDAEFSPDDSLIMTASSDDTIILWDAQTGELKHIFVAANEQSVYTTFFYLHATFSPDGTQIVSGTNDLLTFWDVINLPDDYQSWVVDNRYIPDFTCEQRELYVIEPLCEPDLSQER